MIKNFPLANSTMGPKPRTSAWPFVEVALNGPLLAVAGNGPSFYCWARLEAAPFRLYKAERGPWFGTSGPLSNFQYSSLSADYARRPSCGPSRLACTHA